MRLLDQEWDRVWDRVFYEVRELLDRAPLCSWHDLSVNIHCGRYARMPHLALNGFRVGTSLYQPGCM